MDQFEGGFSEIVTTVNYAMCSDFICSFVYTAVHMHTLTYVGHLSHEAPYSVQSLVTLYYSSRGIYVWLDRAWANSMEQFKGPYRSGFPHTI